ncbi:hypothetical protein JMJ55_03620 [Belnapia sp. T6]|uniref:OmpA-like domain-containing protein n=1 Tax=Belnapia mucosa TaxID=2804532 RepID=A0ABS1V148_9PROT|nr:hypothetical protein [Belnapia mucosa]MBL6454399.1 hypothetical protein [Belnapia mucosa]
MTLRPIAFLLLAALALPAAAQPGPAEDDAMPAPPAATPPDPADLNARSAPPARLALPPALPGLPEGMEARPDGSLRLRFPNGAEAVPPATSPALAELGRRLAALPAGRVTLVAQASGPVADISSARRLSLARAIAVKEALAAGGLPPTRIDIRPMGRTADAVDAVDVQPPLAEAKR